MRTATLTATIPAPIDEVRSVLTDIEHLASWNPAFTPIDAEGAAVQGKDYPLRTVQGFRGTLRYPEISDDTVTIEWSVPGLTDIGTWLLRADGQATVVEHRVSRSGPLAMVIAGALSSLPSLRLERISAVVGGPGNIRAGAPRW